MVLPSRSRCNVERTSLNSAGRLAKKKPRSPICFDLLRQSDPPSLLDGNGYLSADARACIPESS